MLDLERLCQDRRIPTLSSGHHHCHEGWIQLHCPLCAGGRGGWHLGWNTQQGNFNCWRCGALKVTVVLPLLLGTTHQDEVYRVLQEYQKRGAGPAPSEPVERKNKIEPPPGMGPMTGRHKAYLRARKFDPDQLAADWDLQGTTYLSGNWNWRVVYPVRDDRGRITAYQGRSIGKETKPKYKLSDDGDVLQDPKSLLYGLHRVPGDAVVVVEGATGVWRLGAGAVATLGIDWKLEQANRLREYKRRYVLFDPEEKAQERANALAAVLSVYPGETEVLTGFATDPGDFADKQAREIMTELGI